MTNGEADRGRLRPLPSPADGRFAVDRDAMRRNSERRRPQPAGSAQPQSSGETAVFKDRRALADRRCKPAASRLALFCNIASRLIENVLSTCPVESYRKGDGILAPGQNNSNVYLVLSGRLQVDLDETDSTQPIFIEAGECIGELSMIDGKPVSARVTAAADCRILVVDDQKFWSDIISVPGVARNLMVTLSERMRKNNDRVLQRARAQLQLEHLRKELQVAREIQAGMLPRMPLALDRSDVEAHGLMLPASDVGGDFFDVVLLDSDRLFVAVGDVCGKGIASALFMARTVALLRARAAARKSPAAILADMNNLLCENNASGIFVTLLCGVLDLKTGTFSYANGGHVPPILFGPEAAPAFLGMPKGLIVGTIEGNTYSVARQTLLPGQGIVLYSDGVTEATASTQELFGTARFLRSIERNAARPVPDLTAAVVDEIGAFADVREQSDDITLLAFRFLG